MYYARTSSSGLMNSITFALPLLSGTRQEKAPPPFSHLPKFLTLRQRLIVVLCCIWMCAVTSGYILYAVVYLDVSGIIYD